MFKWLGIPAVIASSFNPVVTLDFSDVQVSKVSNVNFRELKDTGIENINYSYFGFTGKVPDTKTINWNRVMEDLWDDKSSMKNVSNASKTSAPIIVENFKNDTSETYTLKEYINELDDNLAKVKVDMDWNKICIDYKLSENECYAFVITAYDINANMLTAYSMTELMPYHQGERNYILMDMYMQNAGVKFLDFIPSRYDTLLSIGRYQFTSYAVGVDGEGLRPTNKIASYSVNYNIPGSVVKLEGFESDYAAYYFSTFNTLSLIRSLNDEQVEKYMNGCLHRKSEIVQYIATAHHNPYWAKKRAISWINDSCEKPLIEYQGKALKIYAAKTASNYEAVINAVSN